LAVARAPALSVLRARLHPAVARTLALRPLRPAVAGAHLVGLADHRLALRIEQAHEVVAVGAPVAIIVDAVVTMEQLLAGEDLPGAVHSPLSILIAGDDARLARAHPDGVRRSGVAGLGLAGRALF